VNSLIARELESIGAKVTVPFETTFADGTRYRNRDDPPRFSIHFRNRAAEWSIAAFGHIGLLDGYFSGDIDFEGDFREAIRTSLYGLGFSNPLVTVRNRWHEFRRSNASRSRAKENARAHYGLGTAFYRLWLDDPLMMYTCGYWKEGTRSLEEAQVNKIEHVCRKVRLAAGESVVDIGCGFGGFMFHAAEHYGVSVTGVNTRRSRSPGSTLRSAGAAASAKSGRSRGTSATPSGRSTRWSRSASSSTRGGTSWRRSCGHTPIS